ncbi:hypothetical protein MPAR168_15335 [Methylorubrum populi]|uniref:Uncharacterized protein n=1 Tax=Methylobacterium radiotolerans TaxID=31998 RepID=A0ABU7T7E3_9HYPH
MKPESDTRRQVRAEILRVMAEARANGADDIRAAQRALPGVPTMVLYELGAELDAAEVDAWWERVERTIDGEVIRNAITTAA